jgi:hypothetical protein
MTTVIQNLTLGIFCAALFSCRPTFKNVSLHPQVQDYLFVDILQELNVPEAALFGKGKNLIWKSEFASVGLFDSRSVATLKNKFTGKDLVMVSFYNSSPLDYRLKNHPQTLIHYAQRESTEASEALSKGFALVALTDQDELDTLASEAHQQWQGLGLACGNIEGIDLNLVQAQGSPTPPVYQETVEIPEIKSALEDIDTDSMISSIKTLEGLGTRYHKNQEGVQATLVVENLFKTQTKNAADFSYEQIDHSSYYPTEQKSLIVSIPGSGEGEKRVILGAHLDSTNKNSQFSDAPGADDDASGIATLIEIAKVIKERGWTFKRTIEFHAYAAEEVGLRGSKDIANRYKDLEIQVASMMQFDMVSYSKDPNDQTIFLVENLTSATLRRSAKDLLNTYLGGGFQEKSLSAGTSDHKSWHLAGYPVVFPFEDTTAFNPAYHSPQDNSDSINNINLAKRFAQLGLAFLGHQAGLIGGEADFEAQSEQLASTYSNDIKLAVLEGDSSRNVALSSPSTVQRLEFCERPDGASKECKEERTVAIPAKEEGGRRFYLTQEPLVFADPSWFVFYGYDEADVLTAQRFVKLTRK